MSVKRIIQIHIFFVLFFVAGIILNLTTGYTIVSPIMLGASIGYYISVILGFIRIKSVNQLLKKKAGSGIGYVLSLSGILFVELMGVCISALYIFLVVVFSLDAQVKAEGNGYQIRLQPSLMWPPRYVLIKGNALIEKQVGDIHANECCSRENS